MFIACACALQQAALATIRAEYDVRENDAAVAAAIALAEQKAHFQVCFRYAMLYCRCGYQRLLLQTLLQKAEATRAALVHEFVAENQSSLASVQSELSRQFENDCTFVCCRA
jgi:hypothetical protein